MKLMAFLFLLIMIKRVLLDDERNYTKTFYHFMVISIFFLLLSIHQKYNEAVRIVPLLVGVLNYFGHLSYLKLNEDKFCSDAAAAAAAASIADSDSAASH